MLISSIESAIQAAVKEIRLLEKQGNRAQAFKIKKEIKVLEIQLQILKEL